MRDGGIVWHIFAFYNPSPLRGAPFTQGSLFLFVHIVLNATTPFC